LKSRVETKEFESLVRMGALLTFIEGIAMLPCALASYIYDGDVICVRFFFIAFSIILLGFSFLRLYRTRKIHLAPSTGYLISSLSWIYCSLVGAIPFYLCGPDYSLISCIFESVAGFTTTGCTVFDLNTMPKGLLLWRAISNWLGGMGILVLVTAVLPSLGIGGQSIASTETTGPTMEKIGGKFSYTGNILYLTYSFFTIAELILLSLGPLSFFDALVNTFSSISTGGLLVTDSNAPAFTTIYIRTVIIIFTILSSMNYTMYYYFFIGRRDKIKNNYEIKTFLKIIAISTVLMTLNLRFQGNYNSLFQSFKDSASQVISFISTSGYYVCDYSNWPTFSKVILMGLLICGGCTMSTSGSLKVSRVAVMIQLIKRGIYKQVHPTAVKAVKFKGQTIPADKVSSIVTHIILYFVVLFVSSFILAFNNMDLETTFTTTLGIFTNTGMALGIPGSSGNFSMFSDFSKLFMALLMLIGRLEIYAVILLFTKSFWKKDKANQI